jgi:hypothetical protein
VGESSCVRSRIIPEKDPQVFFFFSSRLGCLGSLLLSAAVTIVLILILSR